MITKRRTIEMPDGTILPVPEKAPTVREALDAISDAVNREIKTGDQLLDEVIKEPTLDRYLDRSPKVGKPIDYPEMVRILQRKRAAFITAEQKRKEPKIEGEDDETVA